MELHKYQLSGIEFLVSTGRAILADDMGLGKTVQALTAILKTAKGQVLIVCPKTVKLVWAAEIDKWYPDKTYIIVDGKEKERTAQINAGKDFIIVNYEQLRFHVDVLAKMGLAGVIFDEAHRLKNRKGRTRACAAQIARQIRPKPIYFLTGTPILNKAEEIWSLLNMIDPVSFSSFWSFVYRNINVVEVQYGEGGPRIKKFEGPKDPDALRSLLSPYLLRRTRDDHIDLPLRVDTTIPVVLHGEQLRIYNDMKEEFLAWLNDQEYVFAPVVIAKLTRLRQIALSHEILLPPYGCNGAKLDSLLDLIQDVPGKAVIFCTYPTYLFPLQRELKAKKIRAGLICGDVAFADRLKAVREFQDPDSDTRVILVSILAGGEGITLTQAKDVIFLDRHWTPGRNEQAISRVHRQGLKHPITVHDIVAKHTVDDKVHKILEKKLAVIRSVVPVETARDLV